MLSRYVNGDTSNFGNTYLFSATDTGFANGDTGFRAIDTGYLPLIKRILNIAH